MSNTWPGQPFPTLPGEVFALIKRTVFAAKVSGCESERFWQRGNISSVAPGISVRLPLWFNSESCISIQTRKKWRIAALAYYPEEYCSLWRPTFLSYFFPHHPFSTSGKSPFAGCPGSHLTWKCSDWAGGHFTGLQIACTHPSLSSHY